MEIIKIISTRLRFFSWLFSRLFYQQEIAQQYKRVKEDDEEKQQDYLDKNSARLMNIYDKSFWEMKPAAKLTGKKLDVKGKGMQECLHIYISFMNF